MSLQAVQLPHHGLELKARGSSLFFYLTSNFINEIYNQARVVNFWIEVQKSVVIHTHGIDLSKTNFNFFLPPYADSIVIVVCEAMLNRGSTALENLFYPSLCTKLNGNSTIMITDVCSFLQCS